MPVAFEMVFSGGTTEQYDQVIEKMGFTRGGTGAPGGLFHWVTKTDDGLRVVDVWESDDVFQAFAEEQIRPYTAEVGLGEPEITRSEVYNHLTSP